MEPSLVRQYAAPAPRYTSYPTSPHFGPDIDQNVYRSWLSELPSDAKLSLYVHIPFCDTLCWFCGCHTKETRKYAPVARYLEVLKLEVGAISALVPAGPAVTAIHWGGGSPTILSPDDMLVLAQELKMQFTLTKEVEFSVEIDPRGLDDGRVSALAAAGVNRVSIGVQDFDETVQAAINRRQSFAETASVVERLRAEGISAINIDILYGLPKQDRNCMTRTAERIVELSPDRVALFGYAHVPWMKKHQRLIDERDLPEAEERFAQFQRAARFLTQAGYERVGLDHFAVPRDRLAVAARTGTLRRNFQGYTADSADALLGLGASAIGKLPQGYVQNAVSTHEYERLVTATGLATTRGIALSAEDRLRAHAIERLMCDFRLSAAELKDRFGSAAGIVLSEADDLAEADGDGLFERTDEGYRVTARGRPFVRSIAACFDRYFAAGTARHSTAV